jgi:hypothetical protein
MARFFYGGCLIIYVPSVRLGIRPAWQISRSILAGKSDVAQRQY